MNHNKNLLIGWFAFWSVAAASQPGGFYNSQCEAVYEPYPAPRSDIQSRPTYDAESHYASPVLGGSEFVQRDYNAAYGSFRPLRKRDKLAGQLQGYRFRNTQTRDVGSERRQFDWQPPNSIAVSYYRDKVGNIEQQHYYRDGSKKIKWKGIQPRFRPIEVRDSGVGKRVFRQDVEYRTIDSITIGPASYSAQYPVYDDEYSVRENLRPFKRVPTQGRYVAPTESNIWGW